MEVKSQQAFKLLATEIDQSRQLKSNLLIITLPGTGMGRFITEYLSSNKFKSYNILNYDWSEPGILEKVELAFKQANPEEKFAVTLNFPHLLNTPDFKNSYFLNHTYRRYYFGVRDAKDSAILAKEINPKLTNEETTNIFKLSHGFAQIIKYLAVNGIKADDGLEVIKKPIVTAINQCDPDILAKLGLTDLTNFKVANRYNLIVNFDLSFTENNQLNPQKLTSFEKNILEKMISQNGSISKSEVSDIKWGIGKYDEFSDQAVNKTMRRLSDKLTKYTIETIPKVGFILKNK